MAESYINELVLHILNALENKKYYNGKCKIDTGHNMRKRMNMRVRLSIAAAKKDVIMLEELITEVDDYIIVYEMRRRHRIL